MKNVTKRRAPNYLADHRLPLDQSSNDKSAALQGGDKLRAEQSKNDIDMAT